MTRKSRSTSLFHSIALCLPEVRLTDYRLRLKTLRLLLFRLIFCFSLFHFRLIMVLLPVRPLSLLFKRVMTLRNTRNPTLLFHIINRLLLFGFYLSFYLFLLPHFILNNAIFSDHLCLVAQLLTLKEYLLELFLSSQFFVALHLRQSHRLHPPELF